MKIPTQLHNPNLRFFLVKRNDKRPMERRWTTENNYCFFEKRLLDHINHGGNYGVVCGIGNLIVLDFDDKDYYENMKAKIPKTFTVQTACSRMYHFYYYLNGDMIKKIGIDENNKRMVDIQGQGSGVQAPGSIIDRISYNVIDPFPIQEIEWKTLSSLFNIKGRQKARRKLAIDIEKDLPEKVKETLLMLKKISVPKTTDFHFMCPFHEMSGAGNLFVGRDGHLFCFHCRRWFSGAEHFFEKFEENALKEKLLKKVGE